MLGRDVLAVALVALLLGLVGCAGKEAPAVAGPDDAKALAHYDKALTMKAANEADAAARELQRALQADPDLYQAYYQLGLIYQDSGQPEVARRVWQTGVGRATVGPERPDYPRERAVAEMRAALAGLEAAPPLIEAPPAQSPLPPPVAAPTAEPAAATGGQWAVLFSSNLKKVSADGDVSLLKAKGFSASVKKVKLKGKTWLRVVAACCTSKDQARENLRKIQQATGRKGLSLIKQ